MNNSIYICGTYVTIKTTYRRYINNIVNVLNKYKPEQVYKYYLTYIYIDIDITAYNSRYNSSISNTMTFYSYFTVQ